jgi:hypothetical protein
VRVGTGDPTTTQIMYGIGGERRLGRIEQRLWRRWGMFIEHVETIWHEPDDGIREARGPRRHFT